MESPSKVLAAVLGLTAFSIAVVAGLLAGVPGQTVLARALVSMMVCYPVGLVLGLVAGRAISEYLDRYRQEHPVTDLRSVAAQYAGSPEA